MTNHKSRKRSRRKPRKTVKQATRKRSRVISKRLKSQAGGFSWRWRSRNTLKDLANRTRKQISKNTSMGRNIFGLTYRQAQRTFYDTLTSLKKKIDTNKATQDDVRTFHLLASNNDRSVYGGKR